MKRTIYICARISPYEWKAGGVDYCVADIRMTGEGWTLLEAREIDVPEVSREDLVPDAIKALQAEQQQIRADAEVKAQAIQSKIDKLLAIEVTA